ncbi:uncharacterized protein LOC144170809 [Haemaphysalis longicornis]
MKVRCVSSFPHCTTSWPVVGATMPRPAQVVSAPSVHRDRQLEVAPLPPPPCPGPYGQEPPTEDSLQIAPLPTGGNCSAVAAAVCRHTAGGRAAGSTWSAATPYRRGHAVSDQTPASVRGLNHAQLDHSRPPVALVAVTEEQRVWPNRSVSSDAGTVRAARFIES